MRVVPLAGQDDQVTGSIVGAVAVTVMHHFTGKQRTAQQRFGNYPVEPAAATGTGISDRGIVRGLGHLCCS
ncbi:hypothetical protein GCM10008937_34180 [Deinococcus depolymerans]|uniref:Uncharacterized protein n=1 Tax=Deinococcus depolymerans TaxID=392408 RepID=A0ABP3MS08_9DEIO